MCYCAYSKVYYCLLDNNNSIELSMKILRKNTELSTRNDESCAKIIFISMIFILFEKSQSCKGYNMTLVSMIPCNLKLLIKYCDFKGIHSSVKVNLCEKLNIHLYISFLKGPSKVFRNIHIIKHTAQIIFFRRTKYLHGQSYPFKKIHVFFYLFFQYVLFA